MRFPELAKAEGLRVQALRLKMDLSVQEFAALCKIDTKTMYLIEAGEHNLCDYNIFKVCYYTNTPCSVLLDGLEHLAAEKYDRIKVK